MILRMGVRKKEKLRYSRKEYEEMAKEDEEREPGMNVYSTIFSGTRGNKTSTLASHRETNSLTHSVKAYTTTFSHSLQLVAAEVRVWSPLYLVLWFDAWSRMTLPAIDCSSRGTRIKRPLLNCDAQN